MDQLLWEILLLPVFVLKPILCVCNTENVGQEAENLESVLNKFWSVENIETKNHCVIHYFEKYVFHNRQRYVTKSTF